MAVHLNSSVGELPGIGTQARKDLKNLDIISVRDLLFSVPFRYDDFSQTKQIRNVRIGETVTIVGTVQRLKIKPAKNRKLKIIEAVLEDKTGTLPLVWFNQEYLLQSLKEGMPLAVAGKIDARMRRCMVNPFHEPPGKQILTGRLIPVYRLSGSLKMHRVRQAVRHALSACGELEDWLPQTIRTREQLPDLAVAIRGIHLPETREELQDAIRRLKFDELFLHQLMFAHVRRERTVQPAPAIPVDKMHLKTFVASLPFALTDAQRKAAWEIVNDLAKPHPMNRLLQGDVGSGKTVVAGIAAASVMHQGGQVVYLAPTEILCAQHYATLSAWFPKHRVALFTRTQRRMGDECLSKTEMYTRIAARQVDLAIGTHTLLQEDIEIPDVSLVVIDEQHRFGVAQRHALLKRSSDRSPHLLSMTATPIPRSLALTIFGDLDISLISQLPKGRKPIATAVIPTSQRVGMWSHVGGELKQGRQAYVVCPLIDPSDALGAKSVKEICTFLKKQALKEFRVEPLHGKMSAEEKQSTLEAFRDKKIDVLVSTTVVEVGVDVPNATMMVVMGAERFGLAQLHQLRGRVGRSNLASFCYLLPDDAFGPSLDRLKLLEKYHDGFTLAEKDLQMRGSGNVFGTAQSGFPDFKLATEADLDLMKKTHEHAVYLLEQDPFLAEHPRLKEQAKHAFDRVHLE